METDEHYSCLYVISEETTTHKFPQVYQQGSSLKFGKDLQQYLIERENYETLLLIDHQSWELQLLKDFEEPLAFFFLTDKRINEIWKWSKIVLVVPEQAKSLTNTAHSNTARCLLRIMSGELNHQLIQGHVCWRDSAQLGTKLGVNIPEKGVLTRTVQWNVQVTQGSCWCNLSPAPFCHWDLGQP